MKKWIVITPEGSTISPNNVIYENFQVLGIVNAETKEEISLKLKQDYEYLTNSTFNEIWIYPLESTNPYITFLELESSKAISYEICDDNNTISKIIAILKEHDFSKISFDYQEKDSYYFEGYSDALQEIRVDHNGDKISIYERYIPEKHYVHFGDFHLK